MHDPVKRTIGFLDTAGRARKLDYGAATFTFGPESVITPHGHQHMVSAHLVIEGRVRIRTFDRLGERDGALIIRPSLNRLCQAGEGAAMSPTADNVHWFAPRSATATTFDVIIDGLDPGQEDYKIQPVDPLGGEHRADGTIIAPIIGFEDSMLRYNAHL